MCLECGVSLILETPHGAGCSQYDASAWEFADGPDTDLTRGMRVAQEMIEERVDLFIRAQAKFALEGELEKVPAAIANSIRKDQQKTIDDTISDYQPAILLSIMQTFTFLLENDMVDQEKYLAFIGSLGKEFDGFPE